METETAREFPNSLDRVEFGAVGREEVERESGQLLLSPGQVQTRTMILGVVADDDDVPASGRAGFTQELQKLPEAFAIEAVRFAAIKELAVSQSHGAEVSDATPGRVMIEDRILDFRRYPHATARTMLLEVYFVQRPQIGGRISH